MRPAKNTPFFPHRALTTAGSTEALVVSSCNSTSHYKESFNHVLFESQVVPTNQLAVLEFKIPWMKGQQPDKLCSPISFRRSHPPINATGVPLPSTFFQGRAPSLVTATVIGGQAFGGRKINSGTIPIQGLFLYVRSITVCSLLLTRNETQH